MIIPSVEVAKFLRGWDQQELVSPIYFGSPWQNGPRGFPHGRAAGGTVIVRDSASRSDRDDASGDPGPWDFGGSDPICAWHQIRIPDSHPMSVLMETMVTAGSVK
jgi:hypothetical protein